MSCASSTLIHASVICLITEQQAIRWRLQRIDLQFTMEVTGALGKTGPQQSSRARYVVLLEVRGNSVGEDSTHCITVCAVEKIQHVAEAKAPWQLKCSFSGHKLEKQHLDQPDHEIDLLIGQDNHAIVPTKVTESEQRGEA